MCQTPASVTDSRNDPGRLHAVSPAEGQGVGQVIIACVIPTKSGVVWSMCDVVVTAGLRLRRVHFQCLKDCTRPPDPVRTEPHLT